MTWIFNKNSKNINMNDKRINMKITYNPKRNINDNKISINMALINIINHGNEIKMNIKITQIL